MNSLLWAEQIWRQCHGTDSVTKHENALIRSVPPTAPAWLCFKDKLNEHLTIHSSCTHQGCWYRQDFLLLLGSPVLPWLLLPRVDILGRWNKNEWVQNTHMHRMALSETQLQISLQEGLSHLFFPTFLFQCVYHFSKSPPAVTPRLAGGYFWKRKNFFI